MRRRLGMILALLVILMVVYGATHEQAYDFVGRLLQTVLDWMMGK